MLSRKRAEVKAPWLGSRCLNGNHLAKHYLENKKKENLLNDLKAWTLVEGPCSPAVVAFLAARDFFPDGIEAIAWLHFNSNIEAIDHRNVIVVWSEWYQREFHSSGHSVQPLIRRTEGHVVAKRRRYQTSIARMVGIKLDFAAPVSSDTVSLLYGLIGCVQGYQLPRINGPVQTWWMEIEVAFVAVRTAGHPIWTLTRHLRVSACWRDDHGSRASVDDVNAPLARGTREQKTQCNCDNLH